MQSDPSGGALFTLTALTEVAILSIQLLLLEGGGQQATIAFNNCVLNNTTVTYQRPFLIQENPAVTHILHRHSYKCACMY